MAKSRKKRTPKKKRRYASNEKSNKKKRSYNVAKFVREVIAPRKLVDPIRSVEAGVEILEAADVPYALAGCVAVWAYVPTECQRITKDADFAVPRGYSEQAAAVAKEMGYEVRELGIGGYGVKKPEISVDFIDRHPYLAEMYHDAVKSAQAAYKKGQTEMGMPVVPRSFLIAMKLVPADMKDDLDVEYMLMHLPDEGYDEVRQLVLKYLGIATVERLDKLARSVGHPGPGRRYKN